MKRLGGWSGYVFAVVMFVLAAGFASEAWGILCDAYPAVQISKGSFGTCYAACDDYSTKYGICSDEFGYQCIDASYSYPHEAYDNGNGTCDCLIDCWIPSCWETCP